MIIVTFLPFNIEEILQPCPILIMLLSVLGFCALPKVEHTSQMSKFDPSQDCREKRKAGDKGEEGKGYF